jgi:osmotically-inducible protein OsmY
LANQLQRALANQPTLANFAQNIRINVQNGRVTLTGNVPSDQDRRIVDDVVRNIAGVVSVTDQMVVNAVPTGREDQTSRVYPNTTGQEGFSLHVEGLSDADRVLAQRILEDLGTEPALSGNLPPVSITVAGGKVTLQGTVSSLEEKRRVTEAMQRIAGVNNLYDQLQVAQ